MLKNDQSLLTRTRQHFITDEKLEKLAKSHCIFAYYIVGEIGLHQNFLTGVSWCAHKNTVPNFDGPFSP